MAAGESDSTDPNPIGYEVSRALGSVLSEFVGKVINQNDIFIIQVRSMDEADLEIVGTGEAADILGVSKQRINQLDNEVKMPAVIARLAATPIWLKKDVQKFAEVRDQGKPPAET